MKTLIKKEIRLLLPAWTAAMLLAIVPVWLIEYFIPDRTAVVDAPPTLFVCLGLLLLGISSFGQEFNSKTFSVMLSQPFLRHRTWRLKISLLGLAFFLVLCAEFISCDLFVRVYPAYSRHFFDTFPGVSLWAVALFTGGLWTSLLLRQEVGAFWVTLLAPAAILTGVGLLSDYLNLPEKSAEWADDLAVLVYSAAGFLFARRLFLSAQDTQWTGGNFFFWRRRNKEQASSFVFSAIPNRFAMLLWKEIQLHEANLFIAAIILVVNLCTAGLLPYVSNSNLKMTLEFVWGLWLLMPLLIGCTAVAEERRIGIIESQLCLPVSRRAQFFIKFSVALILSVVLGALMPTIIERTRNFGVTDWTDFWIYYAASAFFLISFYASTLARSTLQAIGIAIAIPIVIVAALPVFFKVIVNPESVFYSGYRATGMAMLTIAVGSPLMILILGLQGFHNFKWFWEHWKLWRLNIAAVVVAFVATLLLTNVIYDRAWERFTPQDEHYGPARISDLSALRLSAGHEAITALFADGRLWMEQLEPGNFRTWSMLPNLATEHYIAGSDWVDAAMDRSRLTAIRSDGSLWSVSKEFVNRADAYPLTRIGSDNNWLQVGGWATSFLLIKKDGTIWLWGRTNTSSWSEDELKADLRVPPKCLSQETNWIGFVQPYSDQEPFIEKNNGSVWRLQWIPASRPSRRWEGSFEIKPLPWRFRGAVPGDFTYDGRWRAEVTTNGQLWVTHSIGHVEKFQIGEDAKWKGVTFTAENSIIALRIDGTLWKWTEHWPGTQNPASIKPQQLGTYSHWLALRPMNGNFEGSIALAADGSLWCWDGPSGRIWLAPSRRPVYMGNILAGTGDANLSAPFKTQ